MHTEFSLRKSLFASHFELNYSIRTNSLPHTLPTIVDKCIQSLLPQEALHNKVLHDLKGRDATEILDSKLADSLPVANDEMMRVKGNLLMEQSASDASAFEILVQTPFLSFVGNHHIEHQAQVSQKGVLPSYVKPRYIARAFPIEVHSFRLGLQKFSSRFALFALGYAPAACETILLDCHLDRLALKIVHERIEKKEQAQEALSDSVWQILKILEECSAESIQQNFKAQF